MEVSNKDRLICGLNVHREFFCEEDIRVAELVVNKINNNLPQ